MMNSGKVIKAAMLETISTGMPAKAAAESAVTMNPTTTWIKEGAKRPRIENPTEVCQFLMAGRSSNGDRSRLDGVDSCCNGAVCSVQVAPSHQRSLVRSEGSTYQPT